MGLTLLIGVVPPLRVAWFVTAALGGLLLLYVWALLVIKTRAAAAPPRVVAAPQRMVEPRPTIEPDQHVAVFAAAGS
jgi:hypothetical protein